MVKARHFFRITLLKRAYTAFILAVTICAATQHSFAGANRCATPEDLISDVSPLPHVASALKPGETFNVLTIGSATVFSPTDQLMPGTVTAQSLGVTTGKPATPVPTVSDMGFPMQMAQVLRTAYPAVTINVTVKGGRGMAASEMLDILHTELAAQHYQLVIWQTGTVEAVRNVPAASFYQTLSDGAAAISGAGGDLVLVDPQYSRFLHANTDIEPYEQTLQSIAAQPGVILFRRFDIMHFWATEGQIDLERTSRSQRQPTAEALHTCLGQTLAQMVIAASKSQS